ncbi:hypothetical protein Lfu02_61850 [Longispora fulva]|uniref:HicB-like protein involved in pilus formation n=1 Tax=Longispora fulva TaxID=619741 RepID=A0A8J7GBS5_9ACTN|nr:toxin-antitoxin system HicB family antitoxin [Longispora fulva]MBG6134606.1 hypothetical protein [Longispora fulva]GIG61813.1 hypothetical protein Lfu02_61850 [Longispora fulva]
MNITSYVDNVCRELAAAADLGGQEARALAERLSAPLESAFRLALLDALSAAADEITLDLAPGSVELRLRGREPSFVVTPPPAEPAPEAPGRATGVPPIVADLDEGSGSRINFRLSDQLKARIEEAAGREGLSVNAWLVRAASAAASGSFGQPQRAPRGADHFTGWVR